MKADIRQVALDVLGSVWRSLSHNFWYKLLSVAIAVILWSYVITSNPSITRPKVLDVDIRVTGQITLQQNRNLALLTDVGSELPQAQVRIDVPQQSYQAVTGQNVYAELDLSQIRTTGKQQVKIKGISTLGTVVSVSPDVVEVEVDHLAQRDVPVNPRESNGRDDYWYNVVRTDPSFIKIAGPARVVERVSSAEIELDYAKLDRSQSIVFAPRFLDADGTVLEGPFTQSTTSVTVDLQVYPQKVLPVTESWDELLSGETPIGYQIDDVTPSPRTITVAADPELLDSLTEVQVRPVDVSRAAQSFSRLTEISKLSGVRHYSTENVSVKVDISEKYIDAEFSDRPAKLVGLSDRLKATWSSPRVKVVVNDLYSFVKKLTKDDLRITVDLGQITEPGTYQLPIVVRVDNYPELGYSVKPDVATVTVTKAR